MVVHTVATEQAVCVRRGGGWLRGLKGCGSLWPCACGCVRTLLYVATAQVCIGAAPSRSPSCTHYSPAGSHVVLSISMKPVLPNVCLPGHAAVAFFPQSKSAGSCLATHTLKKRGI